MDVTVYEACLAYCLRRLEQNIRRGQHYELAPTIGAVFTCINRWHVDSHVKDVLTPGDRYVIAMTVFERCHARVVFEEEPV